MSRRRFSGSLLPALLIAVALACPPANAQPFRYQWRLADLAAAEGDFVELGSRKGVALARLPADRLRLLYAVVVAIETVAELDVDAIVVDGEQPNAFAGLGRGGENVIGVNLAMLDLLGNDAHAMAALVGHEVAHLKLAHGESQASRESTTGLLGALGGIVLGGLGVPGGQALSSLTVAAIQSGYSRDDEREADYLGAIWAVEAGFEADGAVRVHESLAARGGAAATPFLSTHPSGPERIATLKALAARLSRVPER